MSARVPIFESSLRAKSIDDVVTSGVEKSFHPGLDSLTQGHDVFLVLWTDAGWTCATDVVANDLHDENRFTCLDFNQAWKGHW
jgi:hypothetical protein